MTAAEFFGQFESLTSGLLYGGVDLKPWTRALEPVLLRIGKQGRYSVRWKGSVGNWKGEWKDLDFVYFPDEPWNRGIAPKSKKPLLWLPQVVVEHENKEDWKAICTDFRKACLYAVPLRVAIGYATSEKQADKSAEHLTRFYDDKRFRNVMDGETLLILGIRRCSNPCKWRGWLRHGEQPWQPLARPE